MKPMTLADFHAEYSSPTLTEAKTKYQHARKVMLLAGEIYDSAVQAYREEVLELADEVHVHVGNLLDETSFPALPEPAAPSTTCKHCGAQLRIEGHLPDCAELPDQDAIEAREEEAGGSNNVCRVTVSSVVWHVNCGACGQSYHDSNKDRPVICGYCGMSLDQPEARPYEVIDLKTDQSHGRFATLEDAKTRVASYRLDAHFAIWHDTQGRVCWCDEYEGDDDRVKQGLGQPNASEHNDNMDRLDRMADDYASEQR